VLKRTFDVLGSIVALLLLSPLLLVITLLIRANLGRPVLFRQLRPGLAGRPFRLLKFRTMSDGRAPGGEPLPDSERMTRLGRWLRSTSLDELPELINVLRGDMSLVGPRPLLMEYLPLYSPEQARRHEVRPGLTGWAQIHGRNSLSWEERFGYDVWYVDHQNLLVDLRILILTLGTVFKQEGITQAGQATMEKFRGTS
jgi:lipopolysaccharide/colanic/teichoic acid biosynthesis glycosyltransferase